MGLGRCCDVNTDLGLLMGRVRKRVMTLQSNFNSRIFLSMKEVCGLFNQCVLVLVVKYLGAFINKIASLKTLAMAAPFERAFDEMLTGKASGNGPFMAIHYREEESIYIRSSPDRITCIFSVLFKDETDKIFAKVFLQVCQYVPINEFSIHGLNEGIRGLSQAASFTKCTPSPLFQS